MKEVGAEVGENTNLSAKTLEAIVEHLCTSSCQARKERYRQEREYKLEHAATVIEDQVRVKIEKKRQKSKCR
jgi:hypothetical protein